MRIIIGLLAVAAALPLRAEPAVYHGQVLNLPEVLVQRPQGPVLYNNVEMARQPDGSFAITGYELVPLANVQSISVERDQYPPGTVIAVVQGFKSMPCVEVAQAVTSRVGNTFYFAFPELPPPDNVRCITREEPMMEAFGLQTGDLAPGDYQIVYGELHVTFTLHPAR